MGRTVIVGDVHGMLLELQELVRKVALTRDDALVFVGDLLDKGPDSVGVVRYARELQEQGFPVFLVMGNHEEKHARFRYARTKNPKPDMKGAEGMAAITDALFPADVAFLERARLFLPLPEHRALVVHAGVLPAMTVLPPPEAFDENGVAVPKALKVWNEVLRVRYVTGAARTKLTVELDCTGEVEAEEGEQLFSLLSLRLGEVDTMFVKKRAVRPKGSFVQLGAETPADPFWAEIYDGRFGQIYFGHNPFLEPSPKRFPHATGLDLGCVFGGHLAAAVLEVDREPSFVTVRASRKCAVGLWEDDA